MPSSLVEIKSFTAFGYFNGSTVVNRLFGTLTKYGANTFATPAIFFINIEG